MRPAWDYRKVDLNSAPAKADDLTLLCAAGAEGWELVTITANSIAYLKRAIPQEAARVATRRRPPTAARGPAK